MNERNITSAWLAKQVGISKVAVSNIVTGKSSPSLDNIIKIASVLNVSITELIGEEKEDNAITCPHCGKKIKIEKGESQPNPPALPFSSSPHISNPHLAGNTCTAGKRKPSYYGYWIWLSGHLHLKPPPAYLEGHFSSFLRQGYSENTKTR